MDMSKSDWHEVRSCVGIMGEVYLWKGRGCRHGYGYLDVPLWARWLMVYVAGPFFGFEQVWFCRWVHDRGWPTWPGRIAAFVHHRLGDFVERWEVSMRYNPPDSGDPHEIGFWSLSDGTRERSPARWYVYPSVGTSNVYRLVATDTGRTE